VALITPTTGLLSEMDFSGEHHQVMLHEIMYGIDDMEVFRLYYYGVQKEGGGRMHTSVGPQHVYGHCSAASAIMDAIFCFYFHSFTPPIGKGVWFCI
jgi:hypothetical protein